MGNLPTGKLNIICEQRFAKSRNKLTLSRKSRRIIALSTSNNLGIVAFLSCVIFFQFALTAINLNIWPFASYNMFAFPTPPETSSIWDTRILVFFSDGTREYARSGNLVPLEFFRASGILLRVFGPRSKFKPVDRDIAAAEFIRLLGNSTWTGVDEILPPLREMGRIKVVGFQILGSNIIYRNGQYNRGDEIIMYEYSRK